MDISRNLLIKNSSWCVGLKVCEIEILLNFLYELKKIDYEIYSLKNIYSAPLTALSGGRYLPEKVEISKIEKLLKLLQKYNIGWRLPLQRYFVTKDDLNDKYTNSLLSLLNEYENNGVIISSDILCEYVRNKYNNLKIISSIIKPAIEIGLDKDTSNFYNELFKKYDIVVVNSSRIFEDNFLNLLDSLDKVEIIANYHCVPNCKMAKIHYTSIEKSLNNIYNNKHDKVDGVKREIKIIKNCREHKKPLVLNNNKIDFLLSKGIKNFKLEGREGNFLLTLKGFVEYTCKKDKIIF